MTASAALERYCRHALDVEALVTAIEARGYEDERAANRRVFEHERLLSMDSDGLRREGRAVEATDVADHAKALRVWFDGWVGRGPNPGQDIRQKYNRASGRARSRCP